MQSTRNRLTLLPGPLALRWIMARLQSLEVLRNALPWTGVSGLVALVLVALLFISGVAMTFYYSPAPGAAYDSVDYAQFSVPFGDLIRGVHFYAWNLLLVVIGVHLAWAFVVGAYKAPWQMVWVSGVLVMLLVPAFIVTGDLLPWNQRGYWSTQVRLSIVASVPLVGDFLARLLRGGSHIGIVTLTRFYVLHILVLPCLFVFLLAIHFYCVGRQVRSAPPAGDGRDRGTIPCLPDLIHRWLALLLTVTVVLGLVAWQYPVPLGDPADPTDTSYMPKPEWWVLFLNQLVTTLKGPLMVCGTVLIPGGLVGLLIALPFLDRAPECHPARRKKAMLAAAVIAVVLLGLSIIGYIKHYLQTR